MRRPTGDECQVADAGPHGGILHEWDINVSGRAGKIVLCAAHESKFVLQESRPPDDGCGCRLCRRRRRV